MEAETVTLTPKPKRSQRTPEDRANWFDFEDYDPLADLRRVFSQPAPRECEECEFVRIPDAPVQVLPAPPANAPLSSQVRTCPGTAPARPE